MNTPQLYSMVPMAPSHSTGRPLNSPASPSPVMLAIASPCLHANPHKTAQLALRPTRTDAVACCHTGILPVDSTHARTRRCLMGAVAVESSKCLCPDRPGPARDPVHDSWCLGL